MLSYSVSRPHSFKKGTPMYWSLLGNWLPDPPFYANAWRSRGEWEAEVETKRHWPGPKEAARNQERWTDFRQGLRPVCSPVRYGK